MAGNLPVENPERLKSQNPPGVQADGEPQRARPHTRPCEDQAHCRERREIRHEKPRIGEMQAERIVKFCGEGSDTSGKVAIVQGVVTSGASGFARKGIENVLSKHPEIKIVADQAADWDATKARNITATILQANPDICGIMGMWDVMDTGTAAAVQEFNKRAKRDKPVYLNTSGGGAKFSCDNVMDGTFDEVISYNVPGQGRDIFALISYLLQSKVKPGEYKVSIISPLYLLNKETIKSDSCWDPAELKKK